MNIHSKAQFSFSSSPLIANYLVALLVGLFVGMVWPLISLILESEGYEQSWIGLNAAAAPLAILLCAPLAPRLIHKFGLSKCIFFSGLWMAILFLAFPLWKGLVPWFILRFASASLGAVLWVANETWILNIAKEKNRGKLVSIYVLSLNLGFALGPALITLTGIEGWTPFVVLSLIAGLISLPMLFLRRTEPSLPKRSKTSLLLLVIGVPVLMMAIVAEGMIDQSLLSFLPLYAIGNGLTQDAGLLLLILMTIGALTLQLPIGAIVDRFNNMLLLLIGGITYILIPFLVIELISTKLPLWTVAFLWGAIGTMMYTASLAIISNKFGSDKITNISALLVVMFEIGGVIGPLSSGVTIDLFGYDAFMYLMSLSGLAFVLFFILRYIYIRSKGGGLNEI